MMFNILRNFPAAELQDDVLSYHRLVEAFKFAYAKVGWGGNHPTATMAALT